MTTNLPPVPGTPPMPGHAPKPATKRRRNLIVAAGLAIALGVGGTAYWLSRPSYDDIARDCAHALKERAKGDKEKPSACGGLTDDDYSALLMSQTLDDLGWIDEDGKLDKNKMLEDSIDQP
jgi:hypothetical protein